MTTATMTRGTYSTMRPTRSVTYARSRLLKATISAARITSQKNRPPSTRMVSMSLPPCCRKWSMPAFSVTTLKLMARSALTMAKRTAFATSHPTTRMNTARTSRGRKAPIWCSDSRIGSNSMLTFSITPPIAMPAAGAPPDAARTSGVALDDVEQPRERNAHPVGTIVDLVAKLVNRLLEHEELEQAAHLRARAGQPFDARDVVVAVEERRRRVREPVPPGARHRLARVRPGRSEAQERGVHRVVEGAQHPRHVLERRLLLGALVHRATGLALEVGDDEVILDEQHLPEVVVAVHARPRPRARVVRVRVDPRKQRVARGEE